ncbi:tyrosine-type recombinase/integrase [Mucilaginibacter gilvus]|uniref:Site-specific integrase n=1 Tax=Mucilaginibacter gilvus TaxID=2305909 RepID=A0A3S4Y9M6_9SPHI|nr:site-specific integrase [Mucilaginibacter gilvus]RWY50391.1 site-specific integrase [Mucilaginibacter gilvus]
MSISIRERQLENGRARLILDSYQNGKRKVEKLELFIVNKPTTKVEREANKTTWQMAEAIRATRLLEHQNKRYGFTDTHRGQGSFLDYFKKETNKRRASSGSYGNWQSTYQVLLKFTDGKDLTFEEADTDFLEKFKKYLLEARLTKSNTRLARNSALSYFNKVKAALNQAFDDKIIHDKISHRVKSIREEDTHREYLTVEELKKLIDTECEIEVLKQAFLFSCATGLRWSDTNNLKWKDVEYSEALQCTQLRFVQKKTKSAEILPVSEQALTFMGERGENFEKVFKGLRYSAWYNLKLQQWVMRAGISKHITFHCSRHTYATLMLTHDVSIYTVMKLLGHRHIKTTQIYAKVMDKQKVEAVNQLPTFNF